MYIGKLATVAITALVLTSGGVFAGGKAVGQNDLLLQATKCGNNGGGNDAELLVRGHKKGGGYECVKNALPKTGEDHLCDVDPASRPPLTLKAIKNPDGTVVAAKCLIPNPRP